MNHQRADHQSHRSVAGNAEREHRNEARLGACVVGRFRTGNTGNVAFTKRRIGVFAADFLLKRIRSKGSEQSSAAGKNAEEGTQQSAARDGRRGFA